MRRDGLYGLAYDLTLEFFGNDLEIGKRVKHPDGRLVEITNGQFWGNYGMSNYWYWREVLEDGTLAENIEQGYGWRSGERCGSVDTGPIQ